MRSLLQISQRFIIDEDNLLGKGSTGNVYLGFQASNQNKKYAVKAIDLSKITNPVTQFLLSCQIVALTDLSKQNCRHIVKLQSQPIFHGQFVYLVMELLEGGSLADVIRQNSNGIQQLQTFKLFIQIIQAYRVIQKLEIVHRDIKPDNLIFRKKIQVSRSVISGNDLCFIDFGYCLKQSVPNKPQGYYNVGSPKYMSPQAYKQSKYSQKSDIWAMGVILYEMLHGTTIDAGMNMEQYFDKMQHEGLVNRKGINRQIWQLLVGMLQFQAQRRMGLQEIQKRIDWIQKGEKIQNGKRSVIISLTSHQQNNQFATHTHVKSSQIISSSLIQPHRNIVYESEKKILKVSYQPIHVVSSFQGQHVPQIKHHGSQLSNSFEQSRPINLNSQRQMQNKNYAVSKNHQRNLYQNISNSHIFQPNNVTTSQNITFPSQNSQFQSVRLKSPLQISDRFVIDEEQLLGKGSTGNVYLGFQSQNLYKKYAVKAIDLSQVTNPVTQYLLSCEIVALKDLAEINCKYIVKLEDILFDKKYCYLVMQLLEGGSLADYIRYRSNGIEQSEALNLFKQMFQAYGVIKSLQIIHRDIKPDNLIFRRQKIQNNRGQFENQLCFIDFGYCLKQSVPNKPQGYYNVGSPKYMSPQAYKQSKYSQKSDIWAMGVILYEMLHGTTIDAGMNMEQYFDKMQHEGLVNRKGINRQIWDLLNSMLRFQVQDRQQYESIRKRLQNIVIPLKDSIIVPFNRNEQHQLTNNQFSVNQYQQPMDRSQQKPISSYQPQEVSMIIPELQLRSIQNLNLNTRHSQRSSTQPPNFIHQQHQLKYFSKSHIFPQQNHNLQQLRRHPSAQVINQQAIIHRTPQKNHSSQKIVQTSHLKSQFKGYPLQKIEQERPDSNNMKRSMMNTHNSVQKIRKINFNENYPQTNKFETSPFFHRGTNLNNSFGSQPGQYITKNPYIKELRQVDHDLRNDNFRQSIGVIRSENAIREQIIKDQQNELRNKEIKRQMSLKKLNQTSNNIINAHQSIFTSIKPFQNQNNLISTIGSNIPFNLYGNIIPVQNVYHTQNQNHLNQNINNIHRDPSKIMQNENKNIHQRSFDIGHIKTAQKYFNNQHPIMHNNIDNAHSYSNQKNSPSFINNLALNFVQNNSSSFGNNLPLNPNTNTNTPQKLTINFGSQNIVRFSQFNKSQVKQVINGSTNVIQSRVVEPLNTNQVFRSQFGINSVQQSAQKIAHNVYFEMNDMMDGNILPKDPKPNIRYHQSNVQPKFSSNQNVYFSKQANHSHANINMNQSKILNPNETVSRFEHPKKYSQVINVHSQLQMQNNQNLPLPIDPYRSNIVIQNKNNQHLVNNHVQNNQKTRNHYVSNVIQSQNLQPKSGSNFYPPNNNSFYHQQVHQNQSFKSQNHYRMGNNSGPQVNQTQIPFTNNEQILNKNIQQSQIMTPPPIQMSSAPLSTSKVMVKNLPHIVTQTRKIISPFPNSQIIPMNRNIHAPIIRREIFNGGNISNTQHFQVPTRDNNMYLIQNQNPNIRFQ